MPRVPNIDETRNRTELQVVGNKSDTVSGTSLVSLTKQNKASLGSVGNKWYVDASMTTSGVGKSWGTAFKTITEGYAACSAWDEIYVAGGDYDEGAVVNIVLQGIKIIGVSNKNQMRAMWYTSSASHHILTINAHNVEIANMGFYQTKDTKSAIMCSTTASFFKIYIHDCRFDSTNGEYGVHGGTTYDSPDIVIDNCKFTSWQTAAIYCYCTRGEVKNNTIVTVASKIGIHLPATGGNRGGVFCMDNRILGANSSDTGISTAAVSAGMLFISGNWVCGSGTADIAQFANGQYSGTENYAASTAGGAIIDIDS